MEGAGSRASPTACLLVLGSVIDVLFLYMRRSDDVDQLGCELRPLFKWPHKNPPVEEWLIKQYNDNSHQAGGVSVGETESLIA
jgi:hypothetical protein